MMREKIPNNTFSCLKLKPLTDFMFKTMQNIDSLIDIADATSSDVGLEEIISGIVNNRLIIQPLTRIQISSSSEEEKS